MKSETRKSNHPLFNSCTSFTDGHKGLVVIQQRFNPVLKTTWWTGIDNELIQIIEDSPLFGKVFRDIAGPCMNGEYPYIEVRKLMWQLRMKPIPKEPWETKFY